MNWVYQILKALLDWFRETPPTDVQHGKAPEALKDDLAGRVGHRWVVLLLESREQLAGSGRPSSRLGVDSGGGLVGILGHD